MGSSRRGANSPDPEPTFGRRLRRARLARRWSQIQLARRMQETAASRGGTATVVALKVMISKWENGIKLPNEYNRKLLADTLGMADRGLREDS